MYMLVLKTDHFFWSTHLFDLIWFDSYRLATDNIHYPFFVLIPVVSVEIIVSHFSFHAYFIDVTGVIV